MKKKLVIDISRFSLCSIWVIRAIYVNDHIRIMANTPSNKFNRCCFFIIFFFLVVCNNVSLFLDDDHVRVSNHLSKRPLSNLKLHMHGHECVTVPQHPLRVLMQSHSHGRRRIVHSAPSKHRRTIDI